MELANRMHGSGVCAPGRPFPPLHDAAIKRPASFQLLARRHAHGRVAFLPSTPVTLKALKPKETDLEPKSLGEHSKPGTRSRGVLASHSSRPNLCWSILGLYSVCNCQLRLDLLGGVRLYFAPGYWGTKRSDWRLHQRRLGIDDSFELLRAER